MRSNSYFDTLHLESTSDLQAKIRSEAESREINLRYFEDGSVGISLDESISEKEFRSLVAVFETVTGAATDVAATLSSETDVYSGAMTRTSPFMDHPVFHKYHSEPELN